MSGVYNGLQAQIKNLSPEAAYVPCAAHSLNLVGQSAAESCEEACWFFGLLQEVHNFFTASTHRWEILEAQRRSKEDSNARTSTVKSLSTTRWSARADACKSLLESWHEIHTALHKFKNDTTEKSISRSEAKGIRLKLQQLETAFMTVFGGFLLNRLNIANRKLQAVDVDIFTAVQIYGSLIGLICETQNNFDEYEEKALNLSELKEYEQETKRKKRKLHSDESAEQTEMSGREKLRVTTFLVIIDQLLHELRKRREAYQQFHEKFSFLTNLTALSPAEVGKRAAALKNVYSSDLEDGFVEECLHFRCQCISSRNQTDTPMTLLKWLRNQDLHSIYPNVDIALRMCVCIPITNCSGERSFSCLRRVKNYLRSKMNEERLNALAILSIESQLLRSLDCDELINRFAAQKVRKKTIRG